MILAGTGEVLDGFAKVAAQGSCSSFTGGADEDHGEARIVGHGDEGGFAVAGDAFDADVFGVDSGIGLEIVETAAGSPSPGAQCSPLIGSARLAFVDEADDAASEAGTVVRLRGLRIDHGEAPAGGDELPCVGWITIGIHLRKLKWDGAHGIPAGMLRDDRREGWVLFDEERFERGVDAGQFFRRRLDGRGEFAAAEHHEDGDGTFGIGGRDEGHAEVDADEGIGGVVDVAVELRLR